MTTLALKDRAACIKGTLGKRIRSNGRENLVQFRSLEKNANERDNEAIKTSGLERQKMVSSSSTAETNTKQNQRQQQQQQQHRQ